MIRKLRLEKGLEQWELAKKLRVDKNTLYEWENERKGPSRKGTERLERFFKVSTKILEDFQRRKGRKVSEEG